MYSELAVACTSTDLRQQEDPETPFAGDPPPTGAGPASRSRFSGLVVCIQF